ncbi:MAG: AAA family ATPase, partial [Chloroflexi bacterium]|nr:AAA family ATPase [Chloroflexota bacterium]
MVEREGFPSPATSGEASPAGHCSACGASGPPGQRFCGQCGASLARGCPACGAENPPTNRFCGACGAKLDAAAMAEPEPAPPSPLREERRWATVLFADLSGFTSLSEQMDPEDVKALAHRSAERLATEVRRFDGTVINVMGDAIMAVFGAPLAHEDDAERAVRAAFAMRACALADGAQTPLELHIGINTGEVMAGLVGPEERCDYTVMGDTTNTAARLMSAAPTGSVLVGEETYRATRRLVRYRDLPPIEAKGKERPVPAWEALDVAPVPESRPLGTAPLVGRADELALLSGTWTKVCREARPHLVTVLGEPGIGKSRLVAEFERHSLGEALVLHGRCLPYGEALGYWAFATALKEAATISADDDADVARARLADLVTGVIPETEGAPVEVARHLALLSGLDTEDDRAAPAADQRTLHASARRFLEALARRQPLCLLLEDIHWADDALLDLVEFVVARAHAAPLLIVAQARPELLEKHPAWGRGVRAFTSLSLEPLDEAAGQQLVLALCQERGLPEDVAERVGRGAGGNPLFAEELVATVAERGGAAGIPSAIKALISARLDALPIEERSALQLAAVFGKVFWDGGLDALGPSAGAIGPRASVTEQLDALEH